MKINNIQIVTAFEMDRSIVLTCGPALKELQKKYNGNIFTVNAPEEAPPQMPRVVFRLEDAVLNIALDRLQLTMAIPSHIADNLQEAIKYSKQRAYSLIPNLIQVMPEYKWSGIIIELEIYEENRKSKSGIEAVIPIFDKLINIDRKNRDLSSFELQYGFKESEFYTTYKIRGFERRKIVISNSSQDSTYVDALNLPIEASGIEIIVDINNKPRIENGDPKEDISNILNKQIIKIENLASELNLEGII